MKKKEIVSLIAFLAAVCVVAAVFTVAIWLGNRSARTREPTTVTMDLIYDDSRAYVSFPKEQSWLSSLLSSLRLPNVW